MTWQIRTPVKRVICLSTTHIGFIDFIAELESIVGISGKSLVVHEKLQKGLQQATIADVGYDENLDYETIVRLKPDVVFAYGVSMAVTHTVKKLNELGIAVVLVGEYLEEEPLAKMEWVKLFAAFYNRLPETTRRFDTVAARYQHLATLASALPEKPRVMLGLPWSGTWYVSGSQSYIARMIGDAGGKYIMDHLEFNESRPVALEEIYFRAMMADFWINPGSALSKSDILSVDERFGQLPPFSQNRIYNNNKLLSPTGGNAFFESGVVEPDIILSDLIYILHPQLLPSHSLKYYRNLR
jgi:iron complex transport system substrate-binding protein